MNRLIRYRPEIDGLRARAVIPVIAFHAGFSIFRGGFVGVDVFFVISGYLITSIIITQLGDGTFSIRTFYERRARRILPALFLIILISVPFAWLYMPFIEFDLYTKSLTAVNFFFSNILFWRQADYFGGNAEMQPLLHTWSLSVEEQFYVLFPIFLILLWKFRNKWKYIALLFIGLVSLFLAQWFISIGEKPIAAFYLFPSRAWELIIGSILALHTLNLKNTDTRLKNEIGSIFGISMVLCSIFTFSKDTPTPSLFTLIPTIGTALILRYGISETLVGRILRIKFLVSIGLVSYSAYLWHQPIFAIFRQANPGVKSYWMFLALILFIFLLAYLTWKYVETPFRSRTLISRKSLSLILIPCVLAITTLGLIENSKVELRSHEPLVSINGAQLISEDLVLIGDSHASHLAPGLANITKGIFTDLSFVGCLPLVDVNMFNNQSVPGNCPKIIERDLSFVSKLKHKTLVVLSSMGPVYLQGTTFKGQDEARVSGLEMSLITDNHLRDRWKIYEIGLRRTLKAFSANRHITIVLTIDIPELGINFGCNAEQKQISVNSLKITDFRKEKYSPATCLVSRADYEDRAGRYKSLIKNIVRDYPSALLFDPTKDFCTETLCKGIDSKFGQLYSDADHLSENGSRFYAVNFSNFLQQNLSK